jgi:methionyl-tRNA formyltransferase
VFLNMKIIFAGSPQFAATVLQGLKKSLGGNELVAVITQPDKPTGRKRVLTPTPVKALAFAEGIPVFDWEKIKEHVEELKVLKADLMITCAYGQILTQEVLDVFPYGVWNIHASLLPKYRGASPIQSAVLAGESVTGITVMKTERSLDSGDILLVKRLKIEGLDEIEVENNLAELGAEAAIDALALLSDTAQKYDGTEFLLRLNLLVQDEAQVTFCKKIARADAKLDWNEKAENLMRKVRAFCKEPVAWCLLNGQPLNITKAHVVEGEGKAGEVMVADKHGIVVACGSGALAIERAQVAGGKELAAADLVNGRKIKVGDILA